MVYLDQAWSTEDRQTYYRTSQGSNATYAATKAFVNTFSDLLCGELKGAGVHVTLFAPGPRDVAGRSRAITGGKADPGFPVDLHRIHRQAAAWTAERNKMRVVPGVTSKAMSVASANTPRSIVTPIVAPTTNSAAVIPARAPKLYTSRDSPRH